MILNSTVKSTSKRYSADESTAEFRMIKIIGIGSPLGDDQVGWCVAERLKQQAMLRKAFDKIQIESSDRPGMRLLELMEDADTVILIDAVVTNKNPIGTHYRLENIEIEDFKSIWSTHAIGIAEALKIGRALKVLPSRIIFHGIEIDSNNISEQVSKVLWPAITNVVQLVIVEVT